MSHRKQIKAVEKASWAARNALPALGFDGTWVADSGGEGDRGSGATLGGSTAGPNVLSGTGFGEAVGTKVGTKPLGTKVGTKKMRVSIEFESESTGLIYVNVEAEKFSDTNDFVPIAAAVLNEVKKVIEVC